MASTILDPISFACYFEVTIGLMDSVWAWTILWTILVSSTNAFVVEFFLHNNFSSRF